MAFESLNGLRVISRIGRRGFAIAAGALAGAGLLAYAAVTVLAPGVRVASVEELRAYYASLGYTMDAIRGGDSAPRLYVSTIPAGWDEGLDPAQRKSVYFRTLLPLVLATNEEILADRERLVALRAAILADDDVAPGNARWLHDLAIRYAAIDSDAPRAAARDPQVLATLLTRVDVIPPSLALAQGAVESAYGTSQFSIEGNALFGEWRIGRGLVPEKQRKSLGDHRIATFDSPLDAVRSYARNLNTHPAYRQFRSARSAARGGGEDPSGPLLASALSAYSEKGEVYVDLLRELMSTNKLHALDRASLREETAKALRPSPF